MSLEWEQIELLEVIRDQLKANWPELIYSPEINKLIADLNKIVSLIYWNNLLIESGGIEIETARSILKWELNYHLPYVNPE